MATRGGAIQRVGRKRPAPEAEAGAPAERSAIDQQRRKLPAWDARAALISAVADAETLILTGETGCGKTTQIPQFLLAAGYGKKGVIGVTQPRRVAAISVAQRVAEEMGEDIGAQVGYRVRFEESTSEETRICYLTDGMLLREAVADPALRRYSVVVVDEAHERSLQTDMMLALLRRAQSDRRQSKKLRPLKLLVMSATLDTGVFCEFFGGAPAVAISGRQFPVSVFYAPSPQADYLEAAATSVLQIHTEEPVPGDVLVFLTGQEDIEAVRQAIKQRAARLPEGSAPLHVLPLYAALPPALQLKALQPANAIDAVVPAKGRLARFPLWRAG